MNDNDRCLIEACLNRDMASWARLVKKYSALAYVSIENRLKKYGVFASSHDIEDIRQDLFSDIWKNGKLSRVTNRDDISYWIAILSGNAAVEHFRAKGARQLQNTVSLSHKIGGNGPDETLSFNAPAPNDEIARAETEERIDMAMESLPSQEKIMVKLHLIYGKKYHEIAEILSVPIGTVSSYIKRAKKRLREKLKK